MLLCRAEKVRGPDGPLEPAVEVAVKVVSATEDAQGFWLDRAMVQREADILEALGVKPMRTFCTPLHLLHLPLDTEPTAPAYIVMG